MESLHDTKSKYALFNDDELNMLKIHAMESSAKILMTDKYSASQSQMHYKLMNEVVSEQTRRKSETEELYKRKGAVVNWKDTGISKRETTAKSNKGKLTVLVFSANKFYEYLRRNGDYEAVKRFEFEMESVGKIPWYKSYDMWEADSKTIFGAFCSCNKEWLESVSIERCKHRRERV